MRFPAEFRSLPLVAAASGCAGTSNLLLYTSWLWERIDMARSLGMGGELLLVVSLLCQPWIWLADWVCYLADWAAPDSSLLSAAASALVSALMQGTIVSCLTRKFPRLYWFVVGTLATLAVSTGLYYWRDVADIRALVGL